MALPLELNWRQQLSLALARRLPLAAVRPFILKEGGPDDSDPAVAAAMPSYDRLPLAAAASLLAGQRAAAARLGRLACPVLVLHGRHDRGGHGRRLLSRRRRAWSSRRGRGRGRLARHHARRRRVALHDADEIEHVAHRRHQRGLGGGDDIVDRRRPWWRRWVAQRRAGGRVAHAFSCFPLFFASGRVDDGLRLLA
jgi:hypothetical protein